MLPRPFTGAMLLFRETATEASTRAKPVAEECTMFQWMLKASMATDRYMIVAARMLQKTGGPSSSPHTSTWSSRAAIMHTGRKSRVVVVGPENAAQITTNT